jgi:predicted CoA-binding protein
LEGTRTVLVVDWPSRDVPDTLVRSGFKVVVHGGPGPTDYSEYELHKGAIDIRRLDSTPDRADLIFTFRPIEELPRIVTMAQELHSNAVWIQSGLTDTGVKDSKGCWMTKEDSRRARKIVEAGGFVFIEKPYIADVARQMRLTNLHNEV